MENFERILQGAVEAGASDVHLKSGAEVIFRIAGELVSVDAPKPNAEWMQAVLGQIVPAHLRTRLDEDHEIDFAHSPPKIGRFRVNIFQQRSGYVMALRLVKSTILSFAQLHLPDTVRRISESPSGIVLVTGATGSGKSTTLAAMIDHINATVRRHILTLEDPIEFLFEDKQSVIEQREVGLDTASFASGLKNVLRQDPDVLVIGEMRDAASAAAAMSAANIGHLVITTLHTVDAAKSVQRLMEFFPADEREQARQQFASTLRAVVCQRLVRTTDAGQRPALEILTNNAAVTKLIHTGVLEKLPAAIELGGSEGMQTFNMALHELVTAGHISQAEALANSPSPEALKMRFQGVMLNETRRILGARD
jgi:twitching motility protein PilT